MSDNYVYISFARADGRAIAERIFHHLHKHKIPAIYDIRDLESHQDVSAHLEVEIARASAVVLCLTPGALRADAFYIRREINYAQICKKPMIMLVFPGIPARRISSLTDSLDSITIHNFDEGMRQLEDWLSEAHQLEVPDTSLDPFYPYLENLYQRIVSFLRVQVFGHYLPMIFSIPRPNHHPVPPDEVFEYFANFTNAFDYLQNRVLLTGEPEVGKTVTLMSYARDAIIARLEHPSQPVPLVASIATWPDFREQSISAWLAHTTHLSQDMIENLIREERAFFLLDGLHQIGPQYQDVDLRLAFIQAMHQCLNEQSSGSDWLPKTPSQHNQVLITCRTGDCSIIRQLSAEMVQLHSLGNHQIQQYLANFPALSAVIESNPTLHDLCRKPFFLSAITYAYRDTTPPIIDLKHLHDPDQLQARVLDDYIQRRRQRTLSKQANFDTIYDSLERVAAHMLVQSRHLNGGEAAMVIKIETLDALVTGLATTFLEVADRLSLMHSSPLDTWNTVRFSYPALRNHLGLSRCLKRLEQSDIQRDIIWTLGKFGSVQSVVMLLALLTHADSPTIRWEAAQALGEIGDERAVEPLITTLQNDPAWSVRQYAALALAKLNDTRAVPFLVHALKDPKASVRGSVGTALGYLGGVHVMETLYYGLSDPDPGVRWQVAQAFAHIGKPAIEPLFDVLRTVDDIVRNGAAAALALMGDGVIPLLVDKLFHGSEETRIGITEALVYVGEPALPTLLNVIEHEDTPSVKSIAAAVLGEMKLVAAISPLIELTRHENPIVRLNSAEALGEIGDERAIPALQRLLQDNDNLFYKERVCDAAEQALLKINTPEAYQIVQTWKREQESGESL